MHLDASAKTKLARGLLEICCIVICAFWWCLVRHYFKLFGLFKKPVGEMTR